MPHRGTEGFESTTGGGGTDYSDDEDDDGFDDETGFESTEGNYYDDNPTTPTDSDGSDDGGTSGDIGDGSAGDDDGGYEPPAVSDDESDERGPVDTGPAGQDPVPDSEPVDRVDGQKTTILGPESPSNPTDEPLAIIEDEAGDGGEPVFGGGDDPFVPDDRDGLETEFGNFAGPEEGPMDDAVSGLEGDISRAADGAIIAGETDAYNIVQTEDGRLEARLTDEGLEELGAADGVAGFRTVREPEPEEFDDEAVRDLVGDAERGDRVRDDSGDGVFVTPEEAAQRARENGGAGGAPALFDDAERGDPEIRARQRARADVRQQLQTSGFDPAAFAIEVERQGDQVVASARRRSDEEDAGRGLDAPAFDALADFGAGTAAFFGDAEGVLVDPTAQASGVDEQRSPEAVDRFDVGDEMAAWLAGVSALTSEEAAGPYPATGTLAAPPADARAVEGDTDTRPAGEVASEIEAFLAGIAGSAEAAPYPMTGTLAAPPADARAPESDETVGPDVEIPEDAGPLPAGTLAAPAAENRAVDGTTETASLDAETAVAMVAPGLAAFAGQVDEEDVPDSPSEAGDEARSLAEDLEAAASAEPYPAGGTLAAPPADARAVENDETVGPEVDVPEDTGPLPAGTLAAPSAEDRAAADAGAVIDTGDPIRAVFETAGGLYVDPTAQASGVEDPRADATGGVDPEDAVPIAAPGLAALIAEFGPGAAEAASEEQPAPRAERPAGAIAAFLQGVTGLPAERPLAEDLREVTGLPNTAQLREGAAQPIEEITGEDPRETFEGGQEEARRETLAAAASAAELAQEQPGRAVAVGLPAALAEPTAGGEAAILGGLAAGAIGVDLAGRIREFEEGDEETPDPGFGAPEIDVPEEAPEEVAEIDVPEERPDTSGEIDALEEAPEAFVEIDVPEERPDTTGELDTPEPEEPDPSIIQAAELLGRVEEDEDEEEDDLGVPDDPFAISDRRLYDPNREFGDPEDVATVTDETEPGVTDDVGPGIAGQGEAMDPARGETVAESFAEWLEEQEQRQHEAQRQEVLVEDDVPTGEELVAELDLPTATDALQGMLVEEDPATGEAVPPSERPDVQGVVGEDARVGEDTVLDDLGDLGARLDEDLANVFAGAEPDTDTLGDERFDVDEQGRTLEEELQRQLEELDLAERSRTAEAERLANPNEAVEIDEWAYPNVFTGAGGPRTFPTLRPPDFDEEEDDLGLFGADPFVDLFENPVVTGEEFFGVDF